MTHMDGLSGILPPRAVLRTVSFGTARHLPAGHALNMNPDDDWTDARQARLEFMLEEFRAAEQRRLVKQGIALWNRTVAQAALAEKPPVPETLN
jgi:hypothetical protein